MFWRFGKIPVNTKYVPRCHLNLWFINVWMSLLIGWMYRYTSSWWLSHCVTLSLYSLCDHCLSEIAWFFWLFHFLDVDSFFCVCDFKKPGFGVSGMIDYWKSNYRFGFVMQIIPPPPESQQGGGQPPMMMWVRRSKIVTVYGLQLRSDKLQ